MTICANEHAGSRIRQSSGKINAGGLRSTDILDEANGAITACQHVDDLSRGVDTATVRHDDLVIDRRIFVREHGSDG